MEEKGDLKKIAFGDMRAFERIFMRYQPKLVTFLAGFLQEEELCRDMAQDIFLDIWEKGIGWLMWNHLPPTFSR